MKSAYLPSKINDKTVRVAIAEEAVDKDGYKYDIKKLGGGGGTLEAKYSKSGDTEVYLSRSGGTHDVLLEDGTVEKASRSVVAAHEVLGHGRLQILGRPDSERDTTIIENEIREGRGLKKRALPEP